jgi:tetratricopeptide (TPR) repeat protein
MASTFSSAGTSIDRKSLKRPDGFFTFLSGFFGKLASHSGRFVIIVAVFIGLGLVAGYWINHLNAQDETARNALFLAEKSIEAEMKPLVEAQKPASSPSAKKKNEAQDAAEAFETVAYQKLDVDSQFPASVKKLTAIDQNFSRTRSAFEARFKLGSLYYNHGEFSKALPWYEKAAQSAPGSFEKSLALASIASTHENLGKAAEAVQVYQKALNLGESALKGELLLGLARSYEALHDTAKARSTYDQILTELPTTEQAKSAELYKSWLQ